jgi:hypothetical protein
MLDGTTVPNLDSGGAYPGTITWGANSGLTITYGDTVGVPVVETKDASDITATQANLQGELTFMGGESTINVMFQYGESVSYGYTTALQPMTAVGVFNATVTGLRRGKTYHYRAVANFGDFAVFGEDATFTTLTATGASTELDISRGAVFSSYMVSGNGDMLITVETTCTYPPYYPSQNPKDYFSIQLLSVDGNTVLASVPLSNWGDKPTGIYLKPAIAATLAKQGAYQLRLMGQNVPTYPNATYTLEPEDWKGSDLTELDDWCRGTAEYMAIFDDVPRTQYLKLLTDRREVISDFAGGYFTTGIPGIAQIRPYLFETHITQAALDGGTPNNLWDDPNAWEANLGSNLAADLVIFGAPFGATGKQFASVLIFVAMIGVMMVVVGGLNGTGALGAFFIAIPLLWLGTYFKINGVQVLFAILLCCLVALGINVFLSRL